jgi:hypothetical protein
MHIDAVGAKTEFKELDLLQVEPIGLCPTRQAIGGGSPWLFALLVMMASQ